MLMREGFRRQKEGINLLLSFFRPYKGKVALLFSSSVVVGGIESINVAAIYPVLDNAFSIGATDNNFVFSFLAKMASMLPIGDEVIAYSVIFLILALVTFALKVALIKLSTSFAAYLVENVQGALFRKIISADYQYFVDHKEGQLVYNVATAPQKLAVLINAATQTASQLALAALLAVILFLISWQGTLVVLLVGLGYYYFTQRLGKRVIYAAGKGIQRAHRESNVILNEVITGIKQIKVFAVTQEWIGRIDYSIKERWYYFRRFSFWQQVLTPILMLAAFLSVGVILLQTRLLFPDSFTVLIPVLGTFAFALFRLFPVVGTLSSAIMQIIEAVPDCEAIRSIQESTISNIKDGSKRIGPFDYGIEFKDVSFSYKGRERILENIQVVFEKGRTTAIVGCSGSGKTTMVNLILRLYDPDTGEIKIDGTNIKELQLSSWLEKIGFVSQETFIFNDTIRNNITFNSRMYSESEIVEAAKHADAHSFISYLPQGYDTVVGDKGVRLSAGQRQRIAIARAIIKKPEILIFDEATSSLDNISEALVQKSIEKVSENHTAIIVAHRLSTVLGADKIIVLGEGQILEEGTHEELLSKGGAYSTLYQNRIELPSKSNSLKI